MMLSIPQDVQQRLGGLEDRMSRLEASQDDMAETFSSQMLVLRGKTNVRLDDMYRAIPTLREEVRATLAEHRLASQSEIELLKAQGNLINQAVTRLERGQEQVVTFDQYAMDMFDKMVPALAEISRSMIHLEHDVRDLKTKLPG